MRIEEFAPEKKWWKKRTETDFAWRVSIKDIRERGFNLDMKNPNVEDDGPGNPDDLLARYQQVSAEAAELREELKARLTEALG
ncbi:MAG: hypothetical protein SangKO_025320 [Sandaracinaceae bacterium]